MWIMYKHKCPRQHTQHWFKKVSDHLPVVLFINENMNADKPVTLINLSPVRFIN